MKNIVLKAGVTTPCEDLLSMQEEADERMAFHIQHAYLHDFKKVFVLSNDADVLVLLLYHVQSSWHQLEPLYMRLGNGTMEHAKHFLCKVYSLKLAQCD